MSYTLEEYGAIILTLLNKYYLKLFRRYKGLHPQPVTSLQFASLWGVLTWVDLVAKRTGTKVSAQWSNDEVVHQILVDLLTAEEPGELLRKVWLLLGCRG